MCGKLRADDVSKQVKICGWLQYQRMGGLFVVLRDAFGTVQVVMSDPQLAKSVADLPLESVIEVSGIVKQRPRGQINMEMATGEIEVEAEQVKILNVCNNPMPFQIHDFHQVKEALRLQYRYLDLRHEELQRNLRLRSSLLFKIREFLCEQHGFVDVETPTLFRKTPGGAREFVVPTHTAGKYYTLPQSPQQFKQLLMVGGLDRYMQVARCYRDESAKPDRQPEFTQVDIEMSFVTQEGIKCLIEEMLAYSWPTHLPQLSVPFPRMSYADAIKYYGSDKPDTRFDMRLQDITDVLRASPSSQLAAAFANCPDSSLQAVKFTNVSQEITNSDINQLNEVIKSSFANPLQRHFYAIVRVDDKNAWQGSLHGHLGVEAVSQLTERLGLVENDIFILSAGEHTQSCLLLGKLRVELAALLNRKGANIYGSEDKMNFLWVENFPLFLPKEDGSGGLESAHHPFTAPHPDDIDIVYMEPEKVRSEHYDLVLNGCEVGGGSIRIHNAQLQRHVLTQVLKEETGPLEHLLEALDFGCPPHGGIALGVDRLVAILCRSSSIREVIAFPKSSEGRCLMSKAPAAVTAEDVEYYHLPTTVPTVE
jgi:aspartyl-tRNA synthetase